MVRRGYWTVRMFAEALKFWLFLLIRIHMITYSRLLLNCEDRLYNRPEIGMRIWRD